MKKLMELKVQAKAFLPIEATEAEISQTEIGMKNIFGIDTLEDEVSMLLNLEEFLWYVLQKLPAPETPLKIAIHKKILEEAAVELSRTQTNPDMLPNLSDLLLSQIEPYLSDERLFESLDKVPFTAINKVDATANRTLELPAKNIVRDLEFVETLAKVFTQNVDRLV